MPRGRKCFYGEVSGIGSAEAKLHIFDGADEQLWQDSFPQMDHTKAVEQVLAWFTANPLAGEPDAIGHRIVHGGPHYSFPERVTPELLAELNRISSFAPDHLPIEIAAIETVMRKFSHIPQIVCFDTAFHHDLPQVARLLPLPRAYEAKGLRRYGFHGLSYAFLMEELAKVDPACAHERVILAHLGSGASMCAVKSGHCIDTTMSFTPAAGLVMSTRSGDLDPGLFVYLSREEKMTPEEFNELVNKKSGLLGISETSSDVRELLEREKYDPRAQEALALFCYQAKKWIGALSAAMGGLDTLVFAGGIGEHSPVVRSRICDGLEYLGIELDLSHNSSQEAVISLDRSRVRVRVMHTDEELYIAQTTSRLVNAELFRCSFSS